MIDEPSASLFYLEELMKESDDAGYCTHEMLEHRGAVRQYAANDDGSLADP